ncbi:MAG: Rieske 2Fe-2S domain-containing protein [Acidimicrobiia bacterium]|nr:Rieske 2Fe-2S domain-containing protein [Acidimicrobiia bacterium]
MAVVRIGDDWYAVGDVCSHEDYSLSEGDVTFRSSLA